MSRPSLVSAFDDVQVPRSQRGTAAIEFALTLPTLVMLLFGIAVIGSAYHAQQLLVDMAGATARACVAKNLDSLDNITSCVTNVGNYMATNVHKQVCLDAPVSYKPTVLDLAHQAGQRSSLGPERVLALQVEASCRLSSNMVQMISIPINLKGKATMPFIAAVAD